MDEHEDGPRQGGTATRRQFLVRTGALAAGGVVAARAAAGAAPAEAQAPALPELTADANGRLRPAASAAQATETRYDVATFTDGSPQLTSLKNGVAAMKARASTDPTSWLYQANIHATFCDNPPSPYGPVHYSWRFVAWHRAYLWYFEKILQAAAGDTSLTQPYWDWSTELTLPGQYWGSTNPLYDSRRFVTPTSQVDPNQTQIGGLLALPTFTQFGGDASDAGALEVGPHNYIHTWVCGDMCAFATAARDPIFWAHHCNVDRVWWLWNQEGNVNPMDDPAWAGQTYPFYDITQGKTVTISFKDAAQLPVKYAAPVGTTLALATTATGRRPLRAPVTTRAVPAGALSARVAGGSAGTLRVAAIDIPTDAPITVRVFANLPGATAQTPTSDPHFVGSFTLLPSAGPHGHGPVNLHVPLHRAVAQLATGAPLRLTLVPVAAPGAGRMGTVSFDHLEIRP